MKKMKINILFIILCLVLGMIVGYFVGAGIAMYENSLEESIEQKVTFSATIKEIYDNSLLVDGDDSNDINYKGEFTFGTKDIKIVCDGKEISHDDLKKNDKILITFDGAVMESYPAQIANVLKIEIIK